MTMTDGQQAAAERNRRIRSSQGRTKKMNLPLTLELTEPVILADDLNTEIRAQMCSATSSRQQSRTFNALGIIQVDAADVQVDDVIA
jgi:hypothetical protein